MVGRPIRIAFAIAAWLFFACVIAQVFLAGLGVFRSSADFEAHASFAFIFGWLTLVMLVLALVGRLGRRAIGSAAVLLLLFSLQSVLVALRATVPELAALHPVNGSLILLVAFITAMDARTALTPLMSA